MGALCKSKLKFEMSDAIISEPQTRIAKPLASTMPLRMGRDRAWFDLKTDQQPNPTTRNFEGAAVKWIRPNDNPELPPNESDLAGKKASTTQSHCTCVSAVE
jgi:hypothetical protein